MFGRTVLPVNFTADLELYKSSIESSATAVIVYDESETIIFVRTVFQFADCKDCNGPSMQNCPLNANLRS